MAVVAILTCGGSIVAIAANGLGTKAGDSTERAAEIFDGKPLYEAVSALLKAKGEGHLVRQVRIEPGKDPVIVDAEKGDRRGFPISWVNPIGDHAAVDSVAAWAAPSSWVSTKVILGRRNGSGSLVWRVEGRRDGKAEVYLLSPNGTQLSHRRL